MKTRGGIDASPLLLHQPRKPPPQHFPHHPEIIAGRDVLRLDVERAVVRLHEAVAAGDDHRADRIRAHDVGIVVDLDAADRRLDTKGLTQSAEQLVLARGFRQFTRQRLARIGGGLIDQFALLAALRRSHLHAFSRTRRQRSAQHVALVDILVQQHERRRRALVVELRDEGAEHFRLRHRAVGARKIRAIAPVLAGAEEEDFDAELAGFLSDGEDVRLLHAARIDALRSLDRRQRRDAVAHACGALEVEFFRRLVHLARQKVAHGAALAGQKIMRLGDKLAVLDMRDFARARTRAALDLIEQTGPRAVLVIAVGAGAQ